ncbi:MAG: sigma-70 family RNA polymerase sigma factor [Planctomycetes bacterium]|nr:sigma-70 family RNA polymerase sigma factor [Planctomycetota bacterium]
MITNGTGGCLDEAAWEGLEELRDGLRAFLVRQVADENDVEDAIQETFLRAARYRRRRRVLSLRPWALRIALNVLADAHRRGVRTQASGGSDEAFDPPARPAPSPADQAYRVADLWLDGEAASELVSHGLGALRQQDRSLLDAYYGGTCATASAAAECGIPRKLVKVRLHRARQRLARALRRRVAIESRWSLLAS